RKREPSAPVRTDQSFRFSPVTERISPSPWRERLKVSGLPWRILKDRSKRPTAVSRSIFVTTDAVAEKNKGAGFSIFPAGIQAIAPDSSLDNCWADAIARNAVKSVRI